MEAQACEKIHAMMANYKDDGSVVKPRDIAVITNAMSACSDSSIVQSLACKALSVVAATNENQKRLLRHGAVMSILSAMQLFPAAEELQCDACLAIGNLASSAEFLSSVASVAAAINSVVSAMRFFQGSETLQTYGCLALGNLAKDGGNALSILCHGGVALVVAAMSTFHAAEELQFCACLALGNLAMNGDNESCFIGIAWVLSAMKALPNSQRVQTRACFALGNLAVNADNAISICRAGGARSILAAMRGFPSDSRLNGFACLALGNLASSAEATALAIARKGGIGLVLAAMRAFPSKLEMQSNACLALANLSKCCENIENLVSMGAVALTVSAMRRFSMDQDVQMHGCGTLLNIATKGGRCEFSSKDVLVSIMSSMRSFSDVEAIQCMGCLGIGALAGEGNNGSWVVGHGGLGMIAAAMRAFPNAAELQGHACFALAVLIENDNQCVSGLGRDGVLELILAAMRTFPDSSAVQGKEASDFLLFCPVESRITARTLLHLAGMLSFVKPWKLFLRIKRSRILLCKR
eukprot:GILK01008428.1.p1 GENE.GILK01008428.1~~GILK01008428.1.p1  ORF type:complete len:526 (+),score=63.14 GILK01008428.1:48-1625(+)